jgi:hypothetical protein
MAFDWEFGPAGASPTNGHVACLTLFRLLEESIHLR